MSRERNSYFRSSHGNALSLLAVVFFCFSPLNCIEIPVFVPNLFSKHFKTGNESNLDADLFNGIIGTTFSTLEATPNVYPDQKLRDVFLTICGEGDHTVVCLQSMIHRVLILMPELQTGYLLFGPARSSKTTFVTYVEGLGRACYGLSKGVEDSYFWFPAIPTTDLKPLYPLYA